VTNSEHEDGKDEDGGRNVWKKAMTETPHAEPRVRKQRCTKLNK